MALDLLHFPPDRAPEFEKHHFPRYDLESFIWVLVWNIHHFAPSKNPELESIRLWAKNAFDRKLSGTTFEATRDLKRRFIASRRLNPQPGFQRTALLCRELLELLNKAYDAQDEVERNREVPPRPSSWYYDMGGIFTVEVVIGIVQAHLDSFGR